MREIIDVTDESRMLKTKWLRILTVVMINFTMNECTVISRYPWYSVHEQCT